MMRAALLASQEQTSGLKSSLARRIVLAGLGPALLIYPQIHGRPSIISELAMRVPLRCPLHAATGLLCPTCGLGRALTAAVVGDWSLAWAYHPLGPPLLLLLCLGLSWWALAPVPGRRLLASLTSYARRRRRLLVAIIVLYAVWGFAWRSHCRAEGDVGGLCYPGSLAASMIR